MQKSSENNMQRYEELEKRKRRFTEGLNQVSMSLQVGSELQQKIKTAYENARSGLVFPAFWQKEKRYAEFEREVLDIANWACTQDRSLNAVSIPIMRSACMEILNGDVRSPQELRLKVITILAAFGFGAERNRQTGRFEAVFKRRLGSTESFEKYLAEVHPLIEKQMRKALSEEMARAALSPAALEPPKGRGGGMT